jgi:hypothetical protein
MTILRIPTIPNSPLASAGQEQIFGEMQLRRNSLNGFVENGRFSPSLAVYDDSYQNSQAHSSVFLRHMKSVSDILKKNFPARSTVVEVGCGKGDFVELLQSDGSFQVTGYDATYEGKNPSIFKRYLSEGDSVAADIIVLRHVLEHIQAPHLFLKMLRNVFKTAMIYIEVPNHDWILEEQAFFDITYEHVNYFTPDALSSLFDKPPLDAGLCFNGQYQYIIADISSVSEKFETDYAAGPWEDLDFNAVFPNLLQKMSEIENTLQENGKLYVWGAATKGCMFLIHCQNCSGLLKRTGFAVDINPQKCGKYLPGSLVPIKTKEDLFKEAGKGDVLLVSNPNYYDEIKAEVENNNCGGLKILCL